MAHSKYIWYSDTHFNFTFPWTKFKFISNIAEQEPAGLILTGDIACGLTFKDTLTLLAKNLNMPIYFVNGNHDFYGTSFETTYEIIKELSAKYENLIWVPSKKNIEISEKICIIGEDGWYDARLGNPKYVVYNFDWIMLSNFRSLKSFDQKFEYGQKTADESTEKLRKKLEDALLQYKTIYILTHVPPWAEAVSSTDKEIEKFMLPYHINYKMGQMLEEVMSRHPEQNVVVLSGHVHRPSITHIAHNIECLVQSGKYLGNPTEHNILYI